MRPSDVFRRRVIEMRKRRRWTVADLAERVGLDRTAMVKIENGKRGISLDEAIELSAILGASPRHMLTPADPSTLEVAPGELVDGRTFRAWLAGHGWVRPDDVDYLPAELDDDEWADRLSTSVQYLMHRHQQLLDALEPLIVPGSETAAAASDALEAAQMALDEFMRAVVARSNPRPVAKRRVRRAA